MGLWSWVAAAIVFIIASALFSIFGFVIVVVGFIAGYAERGLKFSLAVAFLIYTILFALLALALAALTMTDVGAFLLLIVVGLPLLYVIGLIVTLILNAIAYGVGRAVESN